MLHITLHFVVPGLIAYGLYRSSWIQAWLWMMATMLVDLDHLLADPIYDPERCSIGFHPLHEPLLFPVYLLLCGHSKTRLIGMGLIIHMALDSIDCQVTNGVWMI